MGEGACWLCGMGAILGWLLEDNFGKRACRFRLKETPICFAEFCTISCKRVANKDVVNERKERDHFSECKGDV